jgi:hypothetical protein
MIDLGERQLGDGLLLKQLQFLPWIESHLPSVGCLLHSQKHCSACGFAVVVMSACSNGLPGDDARGVDLPVET